MTTQVGQGLPDLNSEYTLHPEASANFQKNGFSLLRNVCSAEEVAAYRKVITDATYRYNNETRPMEERDTYARAFLQITNLWARDEAVKRYTLAKRFGKIAADLMGVSGVRLYHDQALYKEAGGGHTPWHQDQYYWPIDPKGIKACTMWMPLVDVSVEMGALTFAIASQKEGFLSNLAISDASHDEFDRLVKSREFEIAQEAVNAGDATFHAGWTLHCAPGNAGKIAREVMTIIYIADETEIIEPDNPNRVLDLAAWFPGQKPGEMIGSELNPLIYSRK